MVVHPLGLDLDFVLREALFKAGPKEMTANSFKVSVVAPTRRVRFNREESNLQLLRIQDIPI